MNIRRSERSFNFPSSDDVLARLSLDAGTRTLGELIQERQLAISEILRLRALVHERGETDRPTPDISLRSSAELPPQRSLGDLLTLKDVCTLVSLSRSTIYGLVKAGKFPAPLQVSRRSVRWRRIEVERWQSNLGVRSDHGK